MTLAELSIKRPVFISCVMFATLAIGVLSFLKLGVDLFPNITFPIVMITTPYPGAGPQEIETLVSKVIEDELSSIPGIKTLRSTSRDGSSQVVAEFTLETDVKFAESTIRDRVSAVRRKLPDDVEQSMIRRMDPSDSPVVIVGVTSSIPAGKLFQMVDEQIRPRLEQTNQVGLVTVIGGRKREIQIELDQDKLKQYEISASLVSKRLSETGQNIPVGKIDQKDVERSFRTFGEFRSIDDIGKTVINFLGNDVPIAINQLGKLVDGLVDETSRTYINGKASILLMVFKQSGANTIAVSDKIAEKVAKINIEMQKKSIEANLQVVRDSAKSVRANVLDVQESILLGILLTILVVFLFLGSVRSTLITGLALPNSLIGAFVLMALFGFTINVMTLLALSLAVGLLVDDAIVVRENIFRHIELGKSPREAALLGTQEVSLAVIATTLVVVAVFGPISFLQGVVGQFFKEFGLTICFAMLISLFDALTIAPMLSCYFAGNPHAKSQSGISGVFSMLVGPLLRAFDRFQTNLENIYVRVLGWTLTRTGTIAVILIAIVTIGGSFALLRFVPKTFLSPQDFGEFSVSVELPNGTTLTSMNEFANKIDGIIRANPEIATTVLTVGNRNGDSNVADYFVLLVPRNQRKFNTTQMKDTIRHQLAEFKFARPKVKDVDMVGGGIRPLTFNIIGYNLAELEDIATKAVEKFAQHPALLDVDVSFRPGKPEVQIAVDREKSARLGIENITLGLELRALVQGVTSAVFREAGSEYDIRLRLQGNQRDLETRLNATFVPNVNNSLVRLADVAKLEQRVGPANISREDRGRYVQVGADIAPNGPGMEAAIQDIKTYFEVENPLPAGVSYKFIGQAENFKELQSSVAVATLLSLLFIYLVLASLYESFITPITIVGVLPSICGAFVALFLCKSSLDLNSMIGCILLLGLASKNSILLVDYAKQKIAEGMSRRDAILAAGKTRLRPILMTSIALIAGMLPIAIGLNEASKQRTSMGIAVIGGIISSTLLSLILVPIVFSFVDRFARKAKV